MMGGDSANVSSGFPPPTITVPPRAGSFESFFFGGGGCIPGFSPGAMSLLSGMFSPDSNSVSFSQLLAGATTMASPIPKPLDFFTDAQNPPPLKENLAEEGSDKAASGGYKKNRPMGLFMVPPGLSPSGLLNSPSFLTPLQSPFGMSHQQALAHVTAQAAFSQSFRQMQADYQQSSAAETLQFQPSSVPNESCQQIEDNVVAVSPEASQSDRRPTVFALNKPADDGYNWRKYGQKLVKAKEHPRSYYKCTHVDCPVKKMVERAPDGHITGITYKGQHNHEMPPPNTQAKDGSNARGKPGFCLKSQAEVDILNEVETYVSGARKQLPSAQLPLNSEHDKIEDSAIVIDEKDDDDDDEPSAKRRNTGVGACVLAPSTKTITEPKIVVQTRSEVDLLDDGFKWRKYGQKVVKGNPNPRSYYRFSYAGCNIRKHVERASTDVKSVVTTYEGKHNHDIPIARNNRQSIPNGTSMQSKPKKVSARKPSPMQRGMVFQSKDQLQVFSQLTEGEIAA